MRLVSLTLLNEINLGFLCICISLRFFILFIYFVVSYKIYDVLITYNFSYSILFKF